MCSEVAENFLCEGEFFKRRWAGPGSFLLRKLISFYVLHLIIAIIIFKSF
jgi:hypothetical protein